MLCTPDGKGSIPGWDTKISSAAYFYGDLSNYLLKNIGTNSGNITKVNNDLNKFVYDVCTKGSYAVIPTDIVTRSLRT